VIAFTRFGLAVVAFVWTGRFSGGGYGVFACTDIYHCGANVAVRR